MSESTLNRRQLVRAAAGVAAGGVLVGGTGVASANAAGGNGLVGSWWVTHTSDGDPPQEGVTIVNLIAGGVAVENDINPPGLVATGTWDTRGDNRFTASLWGGFPETTEGPAGYVHIEPRGRLDGDTISGTFTVTIFDTSDEEVASFTGTFEGERL
jgi:hypothetical protein